jgi:hypothetical protein
MAALLTAIDIIPEISSHEEMCTPLIWCEKASLHWPAPSRQAAVLQKHWEEKNGRVAPSGCSISGKLRDQLKDTSST